MVRAHDTVEAAHAAPSVRRKAGGAGASPAGLLAPHASPAALLRLQRLAGNMAVQRAVGGDEVAAPAATPAAAPAGPAAAGGGNTLGDGVGAVSITGPTVGVHSPMMQVDGVVRAPTIIADSVIAASYSPGAGNIW